MTLCTLQRHRVDVIRAKTAQHACTGISVEKSFTYASAVVMFTAETVK